MKVKVTKAPRYTFIFDENAAGWTKDKTINNFFLIRQQDYANEKLKMRGYLFLNDVLDMVGLPRTKAGQIVGWIYDKKKSDPDNFIDFGIFRNDPPKKALSNGIVLNFNVEGNILDKF